MNTLIKNLSIQFKREGLKTFLTHFNCVTRKIENQSMYIGKIDNYTYMTNGSVLMGYVHRGVGKRAEVFTFKSLNQLPFAGSYDAKQEIFDFTQTNFLNNKELMFRFRLIKEAVDKYEPLVIRAITNNFISLDDIAVPQTKNAIKLALSKQEIKENKKEGEPVMNTMQLAHYIRRELKLEGHYHAQMKLALSYAYKIKNGDLTLTDILNNNLKLEEVAITSIEQELTEEEKFLGSKKTNEVTEEEFFDKVSKYNAIVTFQGNKMIYYVRSQDKNLVKTFNASGIELEKFIAKQLDNLVNTFNSVYIYNQYNVFPEKENVAYYNFPC